MNLFKSKNRKHFLCFSIVLILAVSIVTLLVSNNKNEPVSETRFMLDTVCTVTLYEWQGDSGKIIDNAFDICSECEKRFSQTISCSDIYKINHSKGNPTNVSPETSALLRRSIEYCRMSGGEFDITIAPVKALWNFNGDNYSIPDTVALEKAASKVDYTKICVDEQTVTLPDGMGIDLGAIAKGYIADRIAEYLVSSGVTSAIIDLGGNIYVIGRRPDGELWRIGIRKPFSDVEADVVEAADSSVVTSGVYQRYFEKDGFLYHHILRSSDGFPCDTGLHSVTVISKSSEQCDALSTICMLLGYERSLPVLSEYSEISAVFITSDGKLLYYGK